MNKYHLKFKGGQGSNDFWCVNLYKDKKNFALYKNGEHIKEGECRRLFDPSTFNETSIMSTFMLWNVNATNISIDEGHLTEKQMKENV